MDLRGFVKRLVVPPGFEIPRELAHGDLRARPLSRADLDDDLAAINTSVDVIRRTRGGDWPEGPVTEEYDYLDLVWHECEFRDHGSFAYVLRDPGSAYLGCFYLYPLGRRTPLTEELLDHDVDVSWWVTASAYDAGWYGRVHEALRTWLGQAFPFRAPYWSNREIPT
ncbi:MAG TPA: hypothetical protein VIL48_08685 [Acidimicrobiales bacterium]